MKHFTITIALFISVAVGISSGQAITGYNLSNEGGNTLKISSTFDTGGPGPVIQDNSSVALFVPVGLTTPVITNLQGGSWSANIIANSVLESVCPGLSNGYYLVQVSTGGQANLGSVAAGVPEDLFTVSFSGSSSQPVNAFDPSGADPLSACLGGLGVNNTASIDPDGNAGPAPTTGYEDIPVTPGSISLPIELLGFSARPLNTTDARLDWSTAIEVNSSHFQTERSVDGARWQDIGTVAAAGNSQAEQQYSLVDKKVFDPNELTDATFYYRLKMVELDGSFEYSPVREVRFESRGGLVVGELFPNPAGLGRASVQLPVTVDGEANIQLEIFDIQGRVVGMDEVRLARGGNLVNVNTRQLASGVYHLKVTVGNGEFFVKKLVVQ